MTRYAFTADIHGRLHHLRTTLRDARRRGVTPFIDLGDVGTDPCYDSLREVGAQAAFGNYEVTRREGLRPENQLWVRRLKPMVIGQTFLAAHAAPYFPVELSTVDAVLDYILEHNVKWSILFPRLHRDENARWLTYAKLRRQEKQVFFHGHTHIQKVWRVGPSGAMSALGGPIISLDARSRYIVGVGSVGQPEDGPEPSYAVYDEDQRIVELCRVSPGHNKN